MTEIEELRKEAHELAEDNLSLEVRIEDLCEEIDGLKFCLEYRRQSQERTEKSKEKLYLSLKEMTEKHSRAVCERGNLQRSLNNNPGKEVGLELQVRELKKCYEHLEQMRRDEVSELGVRIGTLGKELSSWREKYRKCYNYLVDKAQKKAEKASVAWSQIEYGEYPWEKL